jgi:hypothetical protein
VGAVSSHSSLVDSERHEKVALTSTSGQQPVVAVVDIVGVVDDYHSILSILH